MPMIIYCMLFSAVSTTSWKTLAKVLQTHSGKFGRTCHINKSVIYKLSPHTSIHTRFVNSDWTVANTEGNLSGTELLNKDFNSHCYPPRFWGSLTPRFDLTPEVLTASLSAPSIWEWQNKYSFLPVGFSRPLSIAEMRYGSNKIQTTLIGVNLPHLRIVCVCTHRLFLFLSSYRATRPWRMIVVFFFFTKVQDKIKYCRPGAQICKILHHEGE